MLRDSLIKLIDIMRLYSTPGDVTSEEHMSFCHQALFTNLEYNYLEISIIIDLVKTRGNIIPMVLGETLNGLDLLYEDPTHAYVGNPLLQMWLLDHLVLLDAPNVPH